MPEPKPIGFGRTRVHGFRNLQKALLTKVPFKKTQPTTVRRKCDPPQRKQKHGENYERYLAVICTPISRN